MSETINFDDLSEVMKQFDRKKDSEKYEESGNISRQVATSLGTDTPITVLNDIRQVLSDTLKENIRYHKRCEELMEQETKILMGIGQTIAGNHEQTLAYLSKIGTSISESAGMSIGTSFHGTSNISGNTISSTTKYYHRADEIKTSQAVIACFMMHLDSIISKAFKYNDSVIDTTVMELKDWSSAVTILREVDSKITGHKGVIDLPKRNSADVLDVLDVIASTVQGRVLTCKAEVLREVMVNAQTIGNCVEAIRLRAIECPGILSSSRVRNLDSIEYPYIGSNGSLIKSNEPGSPNGSDIVYSNVRSMNVPQKKIYAWLILHHEKRPIYASNEARKHSNFNKWKEEMEKSKST